MRKRLLPVCVVIPIYRAELAAYERLSLEQCVATLGSHPLVLVKPASLDVSDLLTRYPMLKAEAFQDEYFIGVEGYNRLMLSDDFYARFTQYKYVLIHQLDAFVFADQLAEWCACGYDYIGAPWLLLDEPAPRGFNRIQGAAIRAWCRWTDRTDPQLGCADPRQFQYGVGNGGFSLRRVAKLRALIKALPKRIRRYRERTHHTFNEDAFFSIEANRYWPRLRIPGYVEASRFSWEWHPWHAAALNDVELPFGCHAWNKLFREDWRPVFKKLGYDLDALLNDKDGTEQ